MIKLLALIFSIAILVKLFFFYVFKREAKMFVDYIIKNKTLYYIWYGLVVLISIVLFYFIFNEIDIYTITAVMLGSFTIMGLLLLSYPKTIKRYVDDFFDQPYNLAILFLLIISILVIYKLYFF